LDTIIKYLKNPMDIGVYNQKAIIDFSGIIDYLEGLLKREKKSSEKAERKIRSRVLPISLAEFKISKMDEALKQLKEEPLNNEEFFERLMRSLRPFALLEEFPNELEIVFFQERETKDLSGKTVVRKRPILHPRNIFESGIVPEINDVYSVDKKHISRGKWLFDAVTIKEDGLLFFKNCLQCIPPMKEKVKILKERKHFSTRYTFRPYPLATKLWLQDNTSVGVPSDLKSFLQGASNYIFSAEWRTSIVLSAISVESVLADLYEEKYKQPAPDTPLGNLFRQVREKIDFPPEIARAIEMTNESRISAVHRSRFPVSDKEAVNALWGATSVILWYASQF
jgi:hypothetical protein